MKQEGSNRISSGVIAAIAAAVVAVSGGVAWYAWNSPQNTPGTGIEQPNGTPSIEKSAEIYWLQATDKSFKLVPQAIKVKVAKDDGQQVLAAAFDTLLAGPTEGTNSSTIPQGTKLLGLKVKSDGVHVNLSTEYTSGGGSASMIGRLGQVVYTATATNPTGKVFIEVNGKQLDVLGGEGLELEQPLTRASFDKNYQL
ncbi:GerMN domain-containing protein [Calothrix sp. 336/3]|uniref:GerMN domain-containing protein n=1 Tax=Calothrix sp. 336/3 TaxID=1337936 RepID=UPI0004E2EA02|nr:GerMN domain-containing protein [Calothrix sp. 336/3]AKG24015.1 spore germination protein [Calothrix sp. 336/3]